MAEDKKEKTPEEKAKEFKEMQDAQMATLLDNSGIIGSNHAKSKGGDLGDLSAGVYMNGDEILKKKQTIYNQTKQMYKEEGIAYEPVFPTDGVLVMNSMHMIKGAMDELTLGNLEKIVNTIDPTKAGLKISDKFKNLTGKAIGEMVKNVGDNPSEELKDFYNTYAMLNSSYTKTSAMNVISKNYLNQEKSVLDQIFEKYHPKKEENKK